MCPVEKTRIGLHMFLLASKQWGTCGVEWLAVRVGIYACVALIRQADMYVLHWATASWEHLESSFILTTTHTCPLARKKLEKISTELQHDKRAEVRHGGSY